MKFNLILGALLVMVSYLTCKNFQKTPAVASSQTPATEEYSTKGYNWRASHVIEGSNPDSAGTYQIKKAPAHVNVPWDKIEAPSTSRKAFMSTGWWISKYAYQPSDTLVHLNYQTKTLKFREDQTFDIFEKDKLQETGHWAFEDSKKLLYLSCKNTYFNNTWKVQENGFRMVLLGNTDLNVTGIQIRLDGSKTPPGTE
jgi:hypothetical protein